jgi:hypothetical protein
LALLHQLGEHCCKELRLRKHESKKQNGIAAMVLPETEALGWLVNLLGEVLHWALATAVLTCHCLGFFREQR